MSQEKKKQAKLQELIGKQKEKQRVKEGEEKEVIMQWTKVSGGDAYIEIQWKRS